VPAHNLLAPVRAPAATWNPRAGVFTGSETMGRYPPPVEYALERDAQTTGCR
jgi:hypothetical protein